MPRARRRGPRRRRHRGDTGGRRLDVETGRGAGTRGAAAWPPAMVSSSASDMWAVWICGVKAMEGGSLV
ncbi:hypothetical protein STAFG_0097 [Streptomyces afghaniensis 772]|uniref:Uncharacterized protein n=1 Tax=Streptomyces afghaniensis 772 TaxID=1283301 RepID=S4N4A8_9ACTN|nr:hypothetical protein STAFG_0097 [Streptomyces afghaniensis 772]